MEILANDLSFHGQFHEVASFRAAFGTLMAMRAAAQRFDRVIHCHRGILQSEPMEGVPLQKALQRFPEAERRSALIWLTNGGPFWDESRRHGPDDWIECRDEKVTNRAVGEAVYRVLHGVPCGLVSLKTPVWDFSPVEAVWRRNGEREEDRNAAVENWRDVPELMRALEDAAPRLDSWIGLRAAATGRFPNLTFADDCFDPLDGLPFAPGAADRFMVLFDTLERLSQAFDSAGRRTAEARQIYRDHFTGKDSWFSDSSDSEKSNFRKKLTFPHPDAPGKQLFCPWHGKIRHMTLRLHYSWSGKSGEPVYVVYAGQKLTKR